MTKLTKLVKVNENISINRYDNGWMVEIGGRGHGRQKRFGWRLGTGGSVGQNESPHQCQRWRKHQGAGRLFLGPTA